MQVTTSPTVLCNQLAQWKQDDAVIGFVPTMGNLHQGHLALVKRARSECDRVVTSIFVNPTQFGNNEDIAAYPRTLDADTALLQSCCDYLFCPASDAIYPDGTCMTAIDIPPFTSDLCGAYRPRHFSGVLTVVHLLFNLIQPHTAYFGIKDYQQLWLIQRMVADLHCPVQIAAVDTGRDSDGLALSSRNQYLTAKERTLASMLYTSLQQARQQLTAYDQTETIVHHQQICQEQIDRLNQAGFRVDYFSLRDADRLTPVTLESTRLRLLAAAWLGKARLIDNIAV